MGHLALSLLLFSLLLSSAIAEELCHPDDKRALLKIKKAFNNAYFFASWIPNTDCCDWYVAKCDRNTHRITSLIVQQDDRISGPIPDAVGDLPYLTYLAFIHLDNVVGPIPQSISRLKRLQYLLISHTNVSGSIPDFISQLTQLDDIDLSVNKLSGTIPPSLSKLPKLQTLNLERNQLTGSIPDSFGAVRNGLSLILAKNHLSGPLPKSLGAALFEQIDLSRNNFIGDASFLFSGRSKSVLIVDLSRNQFSFDISKVQIPVNITYLDLNHNKIYGTLPPSLAQVSNFQLLNVSYNQLCGRIPTGGNMDRIDQYSYVHNKCLCGSPLPPCK